MDYKFYMQSVTADGTVIPSTKKDLEKDFDGLRYKQIEGINEYGKPKNVYTESWAESDSLKVFIPSRIVHEPTKVDLTLLFSGDNRFETMRDFNRYVYNGLHEYWDTLRGLKFTFVCKDASKPVEDEVKGVKYIIVKYTLQNLKGYSEINKTK